MILRINSPKFVAGIALKRLKPDAREFTCYETAPILRYFRGWNLKQIRSYCKKKGWLILAVAALLSGCGPKPPPVVVEPDLCAPLAKHTPATQDEIRDRYNCRIVKALGILHDRTEQCWRLISSVARSECADAAEAKFREASVAAEREAGRIP